jgi:hypothetical protein
MDDDMFSKTRTRGNDPGTNKRCNATPQSKMPTCLPPPTQNHKYARLFEHESFRSHLSYSGSLMSHKSSFFLPVNFLPFAHLRGSNFWEGHESIRESQFH